MRLRYVVDWLTKGWQSDPRSSWALEVKGMNYTVTICQRFDRLLSDLRPIRTLGPIARWYLMLILKLFQCYHLGSNQWGHTPQKISTWYRNQLAIENHLGVEVNWFDWAHIGLTLPWVDQELFGLAKNSSWWVQIELVLNRGFISLIWAESVAELAFLA